MTTKPSKAPDKLVCDAWGVLLLLISAKLSLQAHGADAACARILTRCICGVRKKYNFTNGDLHNGAVWKEATMEGLLRLLQYVEREMRETLRNSMAADELSRCAALLVGARALCPRRPERLRTAASSEISLSISKTALS